ncbi:unnamed protein product [Trichogramma brassicae]|uniref:Uncharacterized protein n=1 Tax=Trichogramma brassicae TaxID=86971 RepID=A0A6H5J0M4_9HYME|nr:unnamed protein product [Trichogramma brassicae]
MAARCSVVQLSLSDYRSEVESLLQVVETPRVAKYGPGRCCSDVASRVPLEKAAMYKDGSDDEMKIFVARQKGSLCAKFGFCGVILRVRRNISLRYERVVAATRRKLNPWKSAKKYTSIFRLVRRLPLQLTLPGRDPMLRSCLADDVLSTPLFPTTCPMSLQVASDGDEIPFRCGWRVLGEMKLARDEKTHTLTRRRSPV